MLTGDAQSFYRWRRAKMVALCAAPIVALGGLWWFVAEVLLVPTVPGADTPADVVAQYMMHPKGLPRLRGTRCEAFLQAQVRRLVTDSAFRDRFLAEYRTSAPEQQEAFRSHLFDAFKPLLMRDIERYHALSGAARQDFLDERIVAYNQLSRFVGNTRIEKGTAGPAPSQNELLGLLMGHTTEDERQRGTQYGQALAARIAVILADPELKAAFEARIAQGPPAP